MKDPTKGTGVNSPENFQARNVLLGMAAHDLRAPIHKISFVADMLLNYTLEDERRRELYQILADSADSMNRLIDDLLDITRIESGKDGLSFQSVLVKDLIQSVLDDLIDPASKKNSSILAEQIDDSAIISADSGKLYLVMTNLLTNALKFSPAGSAIKICYSSESQKHLFEVYDQGPGVPEAEQNLLFLPFQRVSIKPTAGEPSSGLGLAIAKRLVDLHSGSIGMNNQPEGGARFWFSIPCSV